MTSETPEPDPRKKRALVIGGIIAVAAIGWNMEDWMDNDPPVHITVNADDEARDAIREGIREEIRASFRGDSDADAGETPENETDDGTTDQAAVGASETEQGRAGERRLVETGSSANQRSFRIEDDDGRGVTISVDADSAN